MHEDELADVPLFQGLSRRELARIGATCLARDYAAGAVLVREGEGGVGLYIIVSGSARVTQHGDDGNERMIALLGPGSVFGEMALLDQLPRSATVTALVPVHVLVLTFFDFRDTLLKMPNITIKLLSVLSQRLRRVEEHLI
jgi:CRP/FNR family transcriptional regulator, cyclic AMP receptor protein